MRSHLILSELLHASKGPTAIPIKGREMELLDQLEPWWRFGLALLIGALIGLEREFVQQKSGDPDFAGIRTFALICLSGSIAAFLSNEFGIALFVIAYLAITALIFGSHVLDLYRRESEGITTEVVALTAPFLGAMVFWGFAIQAAALGVVTALILASKPALHGLARQMSVLDLRATLEFALITAVVLPILPNEAYGPFGVFNPREIWLLVVLVTGISFVGYILIKVIGARRGLSMTGLLGGLVSSTAVTVSLSGRSKDAPKLSNALGLAIILASCVLFPRVLIEVLAVNAKLLPRLVIPLAAMLAAGLVGGMWMWRRSRRGEEADGDTVELKNPLKLSSAIGFALIFAAVLLIVRVVAEYVGEAGIYAAGAIAGLADVDAITLSVSDLSLKGQMTLGVAANTILIAVLVNTAMKAGLAAIIGGRALRGAVLWIFAMILLAGLLAGAGSATMF